MTYNDREADPPLWAAVPGTLSVTSHIATAIACSRRRDHWQNRLAALADHPGSKSELADRTGLDGHQIGKRLPELGDHGDDA